VKLTLLFSALGGLVCALLFATWWAARNQGPSWVICDSSNRPCSLCVRRQPGYETRTREWFDRIALVAWSDGTIIWKVDGEIDGAPMYIVKLDPERLSTIESAVAKEIRRLPEDGRSCVFPDASSMWVEVQDSEGWAELDVSDGCGGEPISEAWRTIRSLVASLPPASGDPFDCSTLHRCPAPDWTRTSDRR
jgi:hypothetical protein